MMFQEVCRLLENNGFKKKRFMHKKMNNSSEVVEMDLLEFDHIFISENETEVYIIEEKKELFKPTEVEQLEKRVAGFIPFLGNRPLKYNINLLLLCPLDLKRQGKSNEIKKLISYERSKYFCRKIFLDTAVRNKQEKEEELSILPSFTMELNINEFSSGYEGITQKIKEVINDELYLELVKTDRQININNVLTYLNINDTLKDGSE
jgi:hypothetical protein